MESPAEAAANGPSPRNFSQVVFIDIPHSYPPATPVTCRYTLTEALTPNSRDWVGIFKVGWSTTKDYHTFVWAEPSSDVAGPESMTRQAVFKDYYLPKDEIEFYQFCYVDSTGQVRGASTPFCFRNPVEQSMESSLDDDLLVITTQEQVEQSVQKIAELQNVLDQKKEENETLQRALLKERQESANVKMQKEQYEEEKTRLARESDQIKEENKDLKSKLQQQMEETDRLKEEVLIQRTKQMEIEERFAAEQKKMSQNLRSDEALRQNEKQIQEKYDRAVMKINQLKEEREELKGKVNALSEEISTLSFKIREKDRELFKMRDSIQLMQVDLQSSEKEKERLSAEMQSFEQRMEDMRREAQELAMRRPQQETQQSSANNEFREQCQTLTSQLQDAKAKLAAEKEVSKNAKRRAEFLDGELQQLRMQLEALSSSYDQAQQRNSKQELLLREAHEAIADKEVLMEEKNHMIELVTQERDELARENQNLSGDLEELRRALTNIQSAPPAESLYMRPDDITAAGNLETPGQAEHVYDSIGNPEQEQSLVCGHCQESFPGITREELEAHEQSHRICPFCSMICDAMEQSVFEDHVYGHEL